MISLARSLAAAGSLVLATTLTTSVRADAPSEQPTSPAQPPQKQDTEGATGGGVVQLVDEALAKIQLRKEQTDALEKLGDTVEKAMKPVEQAKADLLGALAKSLGTGKVDTASVREQIDALAHAVDTAAPTMRAALERLHATLDADQRTQFVAAFDAALRHRLSKSRDMKWADELGLTTDQKERIRDICAEESHHFDAAIGRLVRITAGFDSDQFAIEDIAPMGDAGDRARKLAEALVKVSARISDVLSPDQRQKAADKVQRAAKQIEEKPDETGKISSPLESTGTSEAALWAVRGGGVRYGGYRGAVGYGFTRGYVGGIGYMF